MTQMTKHGQLPPDEVLELSNFLRGYGEAKSSDEMKVAARWLEKLSDRVCAGGIIGCKGGRECTSDHK